MKIEITQFHFDKDWGWHIAVNDASTPTYKKGKWFQFYIGKLIFSFLLLWGGAE